MSLVCAKFDAPSRTVARAACLHLSSSSCFSTSPMICPTLCSALMFSSVRSKSFCRPLISRRRFLSLASHSRDSMSLVRYELRAAWRSSSCDMVARSRSILSRYACLGVQFLDSVVLVRLVAMSKLVEAGASCAVANVEVRCLAASLPHRLEPWVAHLPQWPMHGRNSALAALGRIDDYPRQQIKLGTMAKSS